MSRRPILWGDIGFTAMLGRDACMLSVGRVQGVARQHDPRALAAQSQRDREMTPRRRLLLLDPTLENFTVIADSTSGSVNATGQRPAALILYIGDSTRFRDAMAGSFLMIDAAAKVARVMLPPRPTDNLSVASQFNGFPGGRRQGAGLYIARASTRAGADARSRISAASASG